MFLIDTNTLLRLHDRSDTRYDQCVAAVRVLRAEKERLFVCSQVLAEFWVVLTRPRDVNGWGLDFAHAAAELADLRGAFPCIEEPPDIADRWQRVVWERQVMGKQAHDARLAALMLAHGLTHILTLNPGDFTRYDGITPITPAEVLSR